MKIQTDKKLAVASRLLGKLMNQQLYSRLKGISFAVKPVMDVALLWPEVKDSSNASITCLVDVSFQHDTLRKKKRKSVTISDSKPIIIWIPEAESIAGNLATVAIKDCHEKGHLQSSFFSFPQEFRLSMFEQAINNERNVSPLVLWNSPNRMMQNESPYQLHFTLSKNLNSLPMFDNVTQDNCSSLQLNYSGSVHYHVQAGGSTYVLPFLYWFFALCVIKVIVHKIQRVLKTT